MVHVASTIVPKWAEDFLEFYPKGSTVIEEVTAPGQPTVKTIRSRTLQLKPKPTKYAILVRDEYLTIWRLVKSLYETMCTNGKLVKLHGNRILEDDETVEQELIIHGNSGIGKTTCLVFLLAQALANGWPAVVDVSGQIFYFHNGLVEDITDRARSPLFALDANTLILLEARKNIEDISFWTTKPDPAFIIIASSPDGMDIKQWTRLRDEETLIYTTSLWTWEEFSKLFLLQSRIYGPIKMKTGLYTKQQVFDVFGGIPRDVLFTNVSMSTNGIPSDFLEAVKMVEKVVSCLDPDVWRQQHHQMSLSMARKQQPEDFHRVYHISPQGSQPSKQTASFELVFASDFINRHFIRTLQVAALMKQLQLASGYQPSPGVAGGSFESYAFCHLTWSSQPSIVHLLPESIPKNLSPRRQLSLKIPPFQRMAWDVLQLGVGSDIPAVGVLHGFSPGQKSVDAILAMDDEVKTTYLFQVTRANSHGVNAEGISDIMASFREKLVRQLRSQGNTPSSVLQRTYVFVVIAASKNRALSVLNPHKFGIPVGKTGQTIPVGYIILPLNSPFHPFDYVSRATSGQSQNRPPSNAAQNSACPSDEAVFVTEKDGATSFYTSNMTQATKPVEVPQPPASAASPTQARSAIHKVSTASAAAGKGGEKFTLSTSPDKAPVVSAITAAGTRDTSATLSCPACGCDILLSVSKMCQARTQSEQTAPRSLQDSLERPETSSSQTGTAMPTHCETVGER